MNHFFCSPALVANKPKKRRAFSLWWWWFRRKKHLWPKNQAPKFQDHPPQRFDEPGVVRISFVGHSTFLIQMDGLNILTDPIWSKAAGPLSKIGPKRAIAPGINWNDLPPIDLVLVSHNHYDHMDMSTLKRLERRAPCIIVTPRGNERILRRYLPKCRIVPFSEYGESYQLSNGLKVHFEGAQHWSARGIFDRNRSLWGSFILHSKNGGGGIYFAGDSGYNAELYTSIGNRYSISLALLPIGASKPRELMRYAHMNPDDAIQAHYDLKAYRSLAMHFDTFPLAEEAFGEIGAELIQRVAETKEGDLIGKFELPEVGEVFRIKL